MNVILVMLAIVAIAMLFGYAMYWAFKPLLDEQRQRHAADHAKWDRERERLHRWNNRGK